MKNLLKLSVSLFFTGSLFMMGCYYDNVEELYPGGAPCDLESITYLNDIKPIIDTNCAISGCHVPGTGRKDLTTYQGLKDIVNDGRLVDRVIIQKDMPPSQPLSKQLAQQPQGCQSYLRKLRETPAQVLV